jgi:hypothetical protein
MMIEIEEIDALASEGELILRKLIAEDGENISARKRQLMLVKSYLHTITYLAEDLRRQPKWVSNVNQQEQE